MTPPAARKAAPTAAKKALSPAPLKERARAKEPPPPFNLGTAFAGQEREWLAALETGRKVAGHHGVQGAGTELRWQELLEGILPHRYQVVRAVVIDSAGGQSEQIDLALVDRHCGYLRYGADKVASVRRLHRTSTSFGWAQGTMGPREHFHVLGQGTFERDPETGKVTVTRGPNTLVTFALTLLRHLQLLGSAPAIDYTPYAAWVSNQP